MCNLIEFILIPIIHSVDVPILGIHIYNIVICLSHFQGIPLSIKLLKGLMIFLCTYVRHVHFSMWNFWNFLSFINDTASTMDTIFLHKMINKISSEYFLGDWTTFWSKPKIFFTSNMPFWTWSISKVYVPKIDIWPYF